MSFKFGRFFYLLTTFITGIFFFLLGIFGIILPWSSKIKSAVISFVVDHTLILSLFGLGLTLAGLSIIIFALMNTRRRYIPIKLGPFSITAHKNVIEDYLESYWKDNFPQASVPFEITIKEQSIKIVAELPAMEFQNQKIFIEKIKKDLSNLFSQTFGYPHKIDLFISFKPVHLEKIER